MHRRLGGSAWVFLAWWLGAMPAAAQEAPRWLLLHAATHDDTPPPEPWLAHVAQQLRRRDAYVLAFDEARALFEARGSAAPVPASAADLDTVARQAKQALWHVATGHAERARQSVRVVLERAEEALESLNREADAARNVLNACLYLVRAMLDNGHRDAAHDHVLECRRLVPDISPDPHDHPPEVIHLLREAELDMSTAGTASLRVLSRPPGCRVYVNGRRLGVTPFVLRRLPPGEYRVQAECGPDAPTRVHRVVLAAEPTTLRIDARFDAAVRTDRGLRLVYGDTETASAQRMQHALRVARVTRATTVLLMSPEGDETLRVDRVDVPQERVTASVRIVPGRSRNRLWYAARAVDSLWQGRSLDMRGTRPRPLEPWEPPQEPPEVATATPAPAPPTPSPPSADATARPSREPRPWRAAVGWSLVGVSMAGMGAGWGLFATGLRRGDHFGAVEPGDPGYLARQGSFDRARMGAGAAFAAGGALGVAAVPVLLSEAPPGQSMPWWGWGAGGVGAALSIAGAVRFARDQGPLWDREPIDQGGTRQAPTRLLGAALWAHAAPWLAVPLTHWLRRALGGDVTARVDLGPNRAGLFIGGAL